jgi:hypothetical protein
MIFWVFFLCLNSGFSVEPLLKIPGDVSEILCKPDPSLSKLCASAYSKCAVGTKAPLCHNFDRSKALMRVNSEELRKEVFIFAYSKFQEIISDPENLALCGKNFEKTDLKILTGLPTTAVLFQFSRVTKTVEIAEGLLLNSLTFEDIEHKLYHELGHACQLSRNPNSYHAKCDKNGSDIAWTDYEIFKSEPSLKACVEKSISSSKFKNTCVTARVFETFANLAFAAKWKSFSHWTWECAVEEDHPHPSPAYLNCFLKSSFARRAFCSQASVNPASRSSSNNDNTSKPTQ